MAQVGHAWSPGREVRTLIHPSRGGGRSTALRSPPDMSRDCTALTLKSPPGRPARSAGCRECGRRRWRASRCVPGTRTAFRATAPCRGGPGGDHGLAGQEEGGVHHVETLAQSTAAGEQPRHVGVLRKTETQDQAGKTVAESGAIPAAPPASALGVSRVCTVSNTLRSCSTLLCLRLCSSACGTRVGVGGQEHRRARHARRRMLATDRR